MNFVELAGLNRPQLRSCLENGHPLSVDRLAGTVYEGVSLGLPNWLTRLTWTRFQKAFYRDPQTGHVRGWNIKTIDGGLDGEWRDQRRGGVPRTFGHFDVLKDPDGDILLDYSRRGRGGNGLLNSLRDPLVSLVPGSTELLLGWSYLCIAGRRIGTPSFFALRPGRAVDYVPPAPSGPQGSAIGRVIPNKAP